ncbi:MAG TPA: hypothetical protein VNT50_09645 [Microbacterium sp.]|uniref:hypothetical protein n=1 Tax=Microbacterium sp. TaxID=51671 RepID=UPI002B59D8EB|nr:hypothetical protein [Microbacterium sp.]HWI31745.1 hypothetical protein [Microbacterium sp.]
MRAGRRTDRPGRVGRVRNGGPARSRGRVVTRATEFFGDVLSRIQDPQGNLWWIYRHNPVPADAGAEEWTAGDAGNGAESWESFANPELEYIHSTLVEAMATLRDPRG